MGYDQQPPPPPQGQQPQPPQGQPQMGGMGAGGYANGLSGASRQHSGGGGGGGLGGGMDMSVMRSSADSCLPAGLAASVSQFGMSANAPAFTPAGGACCSGGAPSVPSMNSGASFEQESLRAVRFPSSNPASSSPAPAPLTARAAAASTHSCRAQLSTACVRARCSQAAENLWAGVHEATPAPRFSVPDMNKVPSLGAIEAESMRAAAAGLWDQGGGGGGGAAAAPAPSMDSLGSDSLMGMPPLPAGMLGAANGAAERDELGLCGADLLAGLRLDGGSEPSLR